MYFNKDRIYVPGAYCAAIYDLENRVVYEINHQGKEILDHIYKEDNYVFSCEENKYLNTLIKMNILSHEKKEHSKYIKPTETIKYVWLELTDACNLRCVHCYGDFGYCVSRNEGLLCINDWKKIIDNISIYPNVGIQFIGGEPLAYKGFSELLVYAHNRDIKRIDIFTNGTLLNDELIELIHKCKASVRISIYGHNEEVHDKITGKIGSFKKTTDNIEKLVNKGIKVKLALIIMKENEKYIQNIISYLKESPAGYNGYDVIRNTAPGKKNQHYVYNVDVLAPRYLTRPLFHTSFDEFYHNHYYNSCWSGKLSITSTGDIIPCIFARNSLCGNIKNESLDSILKKINDEWKITKDNVEVCQDCEFRYACHDCRPTAYGVTGNYLSKHERCTYDPYRGVWQSIKECTRELNED